MITLLIFLVAHRMLWKAEGILFKGGPSSKSLQDKKTPAALMSAPLVRPNARYPEHLANSRISIKAFLWRTF